MKIWSLLSFQEKKRAIFLLMMILIMALLDMIGVASILPFMAVLTNPEIIETNIYLNNIFKASFFLGVQTKQQFLFAFGIFVFIFLLTTLAFKGLTLYFQERFLYMREYSIGKRLVQGYLNQPYSWFLNRNSADLGKNVLSEVAAVISNAITPLILLIANSMVTIALISLLFFTNPKIALLVGFTLSLAYGLIFTFSRRNLKHIGNERLINNKKRYKIANEAFGAAKEIKFGGLEGFYTESFSKAAYAYAKSNSTVVIIANIPRYALEAVAFGGIILLILYLMTLKGNFINSIPIISLYVFAGYRLMPALQQIYRSLIQIRYSGPAVDLLTNNLKNLNSLKVNQYKDSLELNKCIELKNINFTYPNSSRKALEDVSMIIPAKSFIGLIGSTGSGKTTIVDIILGLLDPQKGHLEVDGTRINRENIQAWQRSIGYVPQHIYLSDDTVAANIAFGVETENINYDDIERASRIANLHEFVVNELPNQYQTEVGERGVRLSGGQRQRIGIARALYYNPEVLILDEATSALDNLTERAVMEAVNNLNDNITVIIIAHRLTTVKKCDRIFHLENGKLKSQDNFENMKIKNSLFI